MQYVIKKMVGDSLRPVIEMDIFPKCYAMIDTGAEIPVWVKQERQLAALSCVSNAGIRNSIAGFGGICEGNIYRITFNIGGLLYNEIPIIACPLENTFYHMILPATMFDDVKYSIDNIRREVVFETEDNQPVRHLKLRGNDGNTRIFSQKVQKKESA